MLHTATKPVKSTQSLWSWEHRRRPLPYLSPFMYFLMMFNSLSTRCLLPLDLLPPPPFRPLSSDLFTPKGKEAFGLSYAGCLSWLPSPPRLPLAPAPPPLPSGPGLASFLLVASCERGWWWSVCRKKEALDHQPITASIFYDCMRVILYMYDDDEHFLYCREPSPTRS